MLYTTTISDASVYGISAARSAYNNSLPAVVGQDGQSVSNPALLVSDEAYLDFVLMQAIASWCAQYAPVVAPDIPVTTVNGVPQSVPRRQAKTVMELTPHPTYGDMWQAALAAANAMEDRAARIVTVNYLQETLYFEHPKVSQLAISLLGMTQGQVDALFVAAAQL